MGLMMTMTTYAEVKGRILSGFCSEEQLEKIKTSLAIEARPAERIRNLKQLFEEKEERLDIQDKCVISQPEQK